VVKDSLTTPEAPRAEAGATCKTYLQVGGRAAGASSTVKYSLTVPASTGAHPAVGKPCLHTEAVLREHT
jgi:hypothetical protein